MPETQPTETPSTEPVPTIPERAPVEMPPAPTPGEQAPHYAPPPIEKPVPEFVPSDPTPQ